MSASFELGPVDRFVAGAIGEPGQRVFYLQARAGTRLVTLLAEKEQVRALATTIRQLMEALETEPDEEAPPPGNLEQPALPEWRIGQIGLGHDESTGLIAIVVEEAVPEDEEREPATARLEATPVQAVAFAEQALEIVASGRPRCQLCGFPMDAEGHTCPALNGHRKIGD